MKLTDAYAQIMLVGVAALCCPGLFNALTGLGKAGSTDPLYAAQAGVTLYAVFGVVGYFGGVFFNILGHRILMMVGGFFYAVYALGMYLSGDKPDEFGKWCPFVVGVLLGFGAAWFWTAQGTMMMAYSTPSNKGNYIATFWIIFNIGGCAGGLLSFILNWNREEDQPASPASYFTFVGLMLVGAIIVPLFLVNPEKVQKADGTMVQFERATNVVGEIKGAIAASLNPKMMLLGVYFFSSNWYYVYQFNFVNGTLFNIRTRGLNAALYWISQMLGAYSIGRLLDWKTFNRHQQAVYGWIAVFLTFAVAWSAGAWLHYGFEGGYEKTHTPEIPLDLKDSKRVAGPMIIYMIYGIADAALQAYAYWIMGAVAGSDANLASRFAGYYKGVQSIGAAIANALEIPSGKSAVSYAAQFWSGFGLWAVGTLLAFVAANGVSAEEEEGDVSNALAKSTSVLNSTSETAIQRSLSLRAQNQGAGGRSGSINADRELPA